MGKYDAFLDFTRLIDDAGPAIRGLVKTDPALLAIRANESLMRELPPALSKRVFENDPTVMLDIAKYRPGLMVSEDNAVRDLSGLRRKPLFPPEEQAAAREFVLPDPPASYPAGMEPKAPVDMDYIYDAMRPKQPAGSLRSELGLPLAAAAGATVAGLGISQRGSRAPEQPAPTTPLQVLIGLGIHPARAEGLLRSPQYMNPSEKQRLRNLPPEQRALFLNR